MQENVKILGCNQVFILHWVLKLESFSCTFDFAFLDYFLSNTCLFLWFSQLIPDICLNLKLLAHLTMICYHRNIHRRTLKLIVFSFFMMTTWLSRRKWNLPLKLCIYKSSILSSNDEYNKYNIEWSKIHIG